MKNQEARGKPPILALMRLAKLKGWRAQLLDYRSSRDVTGEKDRAGGASALAFYAPTAGNLAGPERNLLLGLARQSLRRAVGEGGTTEVNVQELPARLKEKQGCFVTLTEQGTLRGCIGHILPQEPLYQAVVDNARNAALRDPRFAPVRANELDRIKIELSVLTEPAPLEFASPEALLDKLQPCEDGVLLQIGSHAATFLPQVWSQIPGKTEFLERLAEKAGCAPSAWRGKDTTISIYHVECFAEPDAVATPEPTAERRRQSGLP